MPAPLVVLACTVALFALAGKATAKFSCDGGHFCSPPKECCTLGCCYNYPPPSYRPNTAATANFISFVFWNHWYFWFVMVVSVLSCLGGCCLWRKRHCCCRGSSHRDEPTSERDSTGSCYFPPQYSRCSSFHHAPPPYTEVTSKPDMYPLVISYADGGGGKGGSVGGGGGGGGNYLMVQYFRNYLVRPMARSLSHTSTVDSLSSSFLYNEANTTIPPPYSCAGSLEDFQLPPPPASAAPPPRSVSDLSIVRQQPPPRTHRSPLHYVSTSSEVSSLAGVGPPDSPPQATSPTSEIRDLLDKIQQLPLAEVDGDDVDTSSSRGRRYRHRNAYAPLTLSLSRSKWLPRSAPNTPSSNYPPPLLLARPSSSSSRQGEGSPLLEAADTDEML